MPAAVSYLEHLMIKPCVVIPVYNHEATIGDMVNAVLAQNLPCILVDDGSSAVCARVLDQLATKSDQIILLRHVNNCGKGAAVLTGFKYAAATGYSHALQIDADGQHCVADIPGFLACAAANPEAVIVGCPQYDASVPKLRLYARYLTHVWVWINTLSFSIKDSMCGFRVYPLASCMALAQQIKLPERMAFDTDVLVRLYWHGVKIINVPTRVGYPRDGVSHFRLLQDNVFIARMHATLFFGMLQRLPKLLARKFYSGRPPVVSTWSQINEITFVTGIRILFGIFRLCGRWPFRIALYPVLIGYLITQPRARAASRDYLQHVQACNPVINIKPNLVGVLRHFAAFAESLLDKMLVWSGLCKLDNAKHNGQEYIRNNLAQHRGGLFICAHLGNLEMCRVLSKQCPGLKLTVLVHTKHARAFNQLLAQLDPTSQLNLLQVTEMSPAVAMQLLEKVKQGEFVVIAGDRIPVAPRPRVTLAPFLGELAPFPVGPYVLASLLQCPVYLLFTLPAATGVELHIEPFRELIQLPRNQREQAFTELAVDYAARLEHYCLRAPLQWFNFYDFWRVPKR
jgi:predicted LPLAT superfamily acyltransferase